MAVNSAATAGLGRSTIPVVFTLSVFSLHSNANRPQKNRLFAVRYTSTIGLCLRQVQAGRTAGKLFAVRIAVAGSCLSAGAVWHD